MALPTFRNPPVHEVILSLQFQARTELKELDRLADLLPDRFPISEPLETQQVELSMTPTGDATVQVKRDVLGWIMKNEGPTRVIQAARDSLSVHAVRPGRWPIGPYPGWSAIGPWALGVIRALSPVYGALGLRRTGLRYLNRIAIPDRTDLRDWFTITPLPFAFLKDSYSFSFGQTWERVEGHDHVGATVRLVKIAIEDAQIKEGKQGVLLDIDIFNMRPEKAPSFDELTAWFNAAHGIENQIFGASVTSRLSATFGEE